MASITREPNGRKTIQFVAGDGKRKSVRLGKVPQRLAEEIKVKVEALNAAAISNLPIDNETAQWVAKLGDDLAEKLAGVGLIAERATACLEGWCNEYLASRTDIKPSTRTNLEQVRDKLVRFFGADKPLRALTYPAASDWLQALRRDYAPGTLGRRLGMAKQFMRAAIRAGLIEKNPFSDLKAPGAPDASRRMFVSQEDARKVIDACPNGELRLIVALARFGGIRVPSEYLDLTWQDVNWERARIRITSPKTEHHEGKGERWIPLFEELRPYVEEAYDQAPEGAVHLVNRYRDGNVNLRTHLTRVIRKAGLTPWPKLFVNLRSSRETELAERYPLHVVTAWLGHSIRVAERHYLQVNEDHFDRAAKSGAGALQNPVQQAAAPRRTPSQQSTQHIGDCGVVPPGATQSGVQMYARQDSNL